MKQSIGRILLVLLAALVGWQLLSGFHKKRTADALLRAVANFRPGSTKIVDVRAALGDFRGYREVGDCLQSCYVEVAVLNRDSPIRSLPYGGLGVTVVTQAGTVVRVIHQMEIHARFGPKGYLLADVSVGQSSGSSVPEVRVSEEGAVDPTSAVTVEIGPLVPANARQKYLSFNTSCLVLPIACRSVNSLIRLSSSAQ